MKRISYFALALISGSLLYTSCQSSSSTEKDSIQVRGEGKIRVMPDQVTLTISAGFSKPRMADAVKETQSTVDTVIHILQSYGNKEKDIKTSSISANKDYQYVGNQYKFTGYQAQQTIDFVLHDLSKFTELTAKLLDTKISSIAQIQFSHSKQDSLLREADLMAYDDAHKSATKLAKRADVKLGKLINISNDEVSGKFPIGYQSNASMETYNKAFGGEGFKIAPEVIEYNRNISVSFAIK